ncbi:3-oxoacyl-[acyl-carrier-protein] synthase II [Micromonospora pattaloongensis]|uniref:3-oxoacyl-[acyl-carrier-protein] synthase II n=1 Tax=Micromonospora pattaloongensis TaxID=405436 RepID=A0A1H3PB84_9ACTN|nr:3-oxoacyl-[acyl-carrier-protein] synthase II [Micromonospora pattaloongensis]
MVVFKRAEHAAARGARIHARLVGAGVTADGHDMVQPHPGSRGAIRAITLALAEAGLDPGEVRHVNAHATSTPAGDLAEVRAIRSALGEHPVVTSTKSMTGHLLGAAGAVEAIATILAIRDGVVPPTINVDELDEAATLDVAAHTPRYVDIPVALNNSFGFGGHNVALLFSSP